MSVGHERVTSFMTGGPRLGSLPFLQTNKQEFREKLKTRSSPSQCVIAIPSTTIMTNKPLTLYVMVIFLPTVLTYWNLALFAPKPALRALFLRIFVQLVRAMCFSPLAQAHATRLFGV